MTISENMKLVKVTWIDSYGVTSSWESIEEAKEHKYCKVTTVGFLLDKDNASHRVAMSYDKTTGMVCGVIVIPTVCIKKVEKINDK